MNKYLLCLFLCTHALCNVKGERHIIYENAIDYTHTNIVVLFFSWLSINFLHVLLLVYVWNLCSYVMISKQKCCFHLNSCTVKSCFKHSQFIFMENFEALPSPQFDAWKILVISTQFGTRSMHIHTSNTSLPYLFCLDLLLKLIGACLLVHKSQSWW